jgi:uncharacterized protein (DUF2249 family)
MVINPNTKIAALLKQHPDALETIISISPMFERLRNPLLRKLMAGRASIYSASKISGCSMNEFFAKLAPLGFTADTNVQPKEKGMPAVPGFIASMKKEQISIMDVRPMLGSGMDPLNAILENFKSLPTGQVLKIINSFEPVPLIRMMEKQGYLTYTETVAGNVTETYFYKKAESVPVETPVVKLSASDWEGVLERFGTKIRSVDVRGLEMPLPMLTILEGLDHLPDETALYVYHKRIPVFLLPELAERKFEYRLKEISDTEVHLLIYRE